MKEAIKLLTLYSALSKKQGSTVLALTRAITTITPAMRDAVIAVLKSYAVVSNEHQSNVPSPTAWTMEEATELLCEFSALGKEQGDIILALASDFPRITAEQCDAIVALVGSFGVASGASGRNDPIQHNESFVKREEDVYPTNPQLIDVEEGNGSVVDTAEDSDVATIGSHVSGGESSISTRATETGARQVVVRERQVSPKGEESVTSEMLEDDDASKCVSSLNVVSDVCNDDDIHHFSISEDMIRSNVRNRLAAMTRGDLYVDFGLGVDEFRSLLLPGERRKGAKMLWKDAFHRFLVAVARFILETKTEAQHQKPSKYHLNKVVNNLQVQHVIIEQEIYEKVYCDAKESFTREKESTLAQVPEEIKSQFRQPAFCRWSKTILPVLQLSPYDISPGPPRDWWMATFRNCQASGRPVKRLVHWYGTDLDNWDQSLSMVNKKELISYEEGVRKGYAEVPRRIKAKLEGRKLLSKAEKMHLKALEELKADAVLDPKDRYGWAPAIQEEYQLLKKKCHGLGDTGKPNGLAPHVKEDHKLLNGELVSARRVSGAKRSSKEPKGRYHPKKKKTIATAERRKHQGSVAQRTTGVFLRK